MTEILEVLVWRLTWWIVRLLWLPFLVIAFVSYVVLPALSNAAQAVLSPGGVLAVGLLLLWLWRR